MVKFERPAKPQILEDKAEIWKNELLDLINKYGSFDKIPKKEKDSFFNNTYNHTEIQQTFIDESNSKCVFCEGSAELTGFLNIEHFHPKSIYYEEAFEWLNLFPSCTRCNTFKLTHDTKKEPIIHPENDNPEDYFVYNNLLLVISPNSPNKKKSQITIDKCDLWRISLLRESGGIQIEFAKEIVELAKKVVDYKQIKREFDKIKHLHNIKDALDYLKKFGESKAKYAGFYRYLLRNDQSNTIQEAIQEINKFKNKLGLTTNFELNWD